MFSKFAVAKQVCYFSALCTVPTQMRKFDQQMRNAVAQPSHAMSVAKNIGVNIPPFILHKFR